MNNTKYEDQKTLDKALELLNKEDYQGCADFLNTNIDKFNKYSDLEMRAGCLVGYCLELIREGK